MLIEDRLIADTQRRKFRITFAKYLLLDVAALIVGLTLSIAVSMYEASRAECLMRGGEMHLLICQPK
jgi:hypothetical protein